MEREMKKTRSIRFEEKHLEMADSQGVDVSAVCRKAVKDRLLLPRFSADDLKWLEAAVGQRRAVAEHLRDAGREARWALLLKKVKAMREARSSSSSR